MEEDRRKETQDVVQGEIQGWDDVSSIQILINCPPQQLRDCHVCGEKAGKHSYYGGQVIFTTTTIFIMAIINTSAIIMTINRTPMII